jgi:hypothetical protein
MDWDKELVFIPLLIYQIILLEKLKFYLTTEIITGLCGGPKTDVSTEMFEGNINQQ